MCDAVAADYVGDSASYSKTLARVALALAGKRPALAGIPMAQVSEVRNRLEKLKGNVCARPPARRWIALAVLIGGASVAGLAGTKLVSGEPERAAEEKLQEEGPKSTRSPSNSTPPALSDSCVVRLRAIRSFNDEVMAEFPVGGERGRSSPATRSR